MPEAATLETHYTLQLEDCIHFHRYTMLHVPAIRTPYLLGLAKLGLGVFVIIWLVECLIFGFALEKILALALLNLACLAAGLGIRVALDLYGAKPRQLFESIAPTNYNRTLRLTPQGITETNANSKIERTWEGIVEIIQTPTQYLFFWTPLMASMVPKRVFDSPEAAEQFWTTAQTYWEAARHKSSAPGKNPAK